MRRAATAALLVATLVASGVHGATEKPVDPQTGLVIDRGYEIVKSWCTSCHSARLITQARKTREGWADSIRWMQQTQGLWDLGQHEHEILDYLSKSYGVPASAPLQPPVIPLPR